MAQRDTSVQACVTAFETAGQKLGMNANELADRLGDGRIADLIVELRGLRHLLPHHSRDRIEELLREVGALTD